MLRHQNRRRPREDGDNDNNYDEEEARTFGFRRSRREISWEHRASSSITPMQFMQIEMFYHIADSMMNRGLYLGHVIVLIAMLYQRYNTLLRRLESSGAVDALSRSIAQLRLLVKRTKETFERISFVMTWIISYGELALLAAEDLSFFIRRPHRFHPKRNRTIDDISQRDCYLFYGGMNKRELRLLYRHWRIPDQFRSPHRHVFTGEECFLTFLYHIMKGSPFTEMSRHVFGGDPRHFSYMFNVMNDHVYTTFYHKVSGASLNMWLPQQVHHFRQIIYDRLMDGYIEEIRTENGDEEVEAINWVDFDFDTFRIFGFLDDTALSTARPGVSRRRRGDFVTDVQRSFYSGYFSRHGLKCQVVYLPNGLIGSVFITEIRQNDNGVQNMSGLNNYLLRLLQGTGLGTFVGGLLPALYCDGIFGVLATIAPRYVNPSPQERLINIRSASARQIIEHVFADHNQQFRIYQVPRFLHMMTDGAKIRRMSLNTFFIQNCIYCMHGTRCRFFGQMPPAIEEYIPLDEVLQPPPAVDLGDVYDFE